MERCERFDYSVLLRSFNRRKRTGPAVVPGKLGLHTSTCWRAFFVFFFDTPGPSDFLGKKAKSFVPVIFSAIKVLGGPGTGTQIFLP